jgi:hypothetical protein
MTALTNDIRPALMINAQVARILELVRSEVKSILVVNIGTAKRGAPSRAVRD